MQGSLPSLQRALRRLPHPRPTLFVWGERNFNALIADSVQMYQAPKLLGVDTQLVIQTGQYPSIKLPRYLLDVR